MDYNKTRDAVSNILSPYGFKDVKVANKAMKKAFGNRLSQIKPTGSCEYAYYISCYDEDEKSWELDAFRWDFFYRAFSGEVQMFSDS